MAFNIKFLDIDISATWGFIALLAILLFTTGSPSLVAIIMFALIGHELSHMFMARHLGYKSDKMTLWFLGGLAYIENKALDDDRESFLISIAGPAFNFAMLALGLIAVIMVKPEPDSVLYEFVGVNFIFGVFNLLPAYPMDGGRILKSILGMLNLKQSLVMNITHSFSVIFGLLFVAIGVMNASITFPLIGAWLMLNVYAERRSN